MSTRQWPIAPSMLSHQREYYFVSIEYNKKNNFIITIRYRHAGADPISSHYHHNDDDDNHQGTIKFSQKTLFKFSIFQKFRWKFESENNFLSGSLNARQFDPSDFFGVLFIPFFGKK